MGAVEWAHGFILWSARTAARDSVPKWLNALTKSFSIECQDRLGLAPRGCFDNEFIGRIAQLRPPRNGAAALRRGRHWLTERRMGRYSRSGQADCVNAASTFSSIGPFGAGK